MTLDHTAGIWLPGNTGLILNESNRHHGPAMDQALRSVETPFVLFIDSDCEVLQGGFVEAMIARAGEDPQHLYRRQEDLHERPGF